MRFARPLDQIFRAPSHVRVLRALDELPAGFRVSGRELARRAGVTHPSAARALRTLTEEGLVLTERSVRSAEFRANPEHVLAPVIHSLFEQERRVLHDLRGTLRRELGRLGIRSAHLFGSVAEGTATPTSDVDLAIEPPSGADALGVELERLRQRTKRRYGNELHVVVRSARGRTADARWRRLLRNSSPIFDTGH